MSIALYAICLFSIAATPLKGISNKREARLLHKANVLVYRNMEKPLILNTKIHTLKIFLKANATTGYRWFLGKYPRKLLEPISQQYIAPTSELAGAPGLSEWTFRLNKKVSLNKVPRYFTIAFFYGRSFQTDSFVEKRIIVLTH